MTMRKATKLIMTITAHDRIELVFWVHVHTLPASCIILFIWSIRGTLDILILVILKSC